MLGSFKTIPNPFRQLPAENFMKPKALLKPIVFKEPGYYKDNRIVAGRNP
jgi:hypothetical protein